jgi:3-oxoacyl-[acyl-carrier-protein] synthase-3
MIELPEVVIERAAGVVGARVIDNSGLATPETIAATGFAVRRVATAGASLMSLSLQAARRALSGFDLSQICGVVAATFSGETRFPPLSVGIAGALGLAPQIPAIDLQIACSAYPYALYVASRLASDMGGKVLVVNGDIQSRLTDASDAATAPLFSDAATASVVSAAPSGGVSRFDFLSKASDSLTCPAAGPISMQGFKVFSFVASDVVKMLRPFGDDFDLFVPHQANMYMVRQLAKSLGLESRLVTCSADYANPGSCSVPLALAASGRPGRALVCGFGAGLSAAAATVRLADTIAAGVEVENAA